MKAIRVTQYGEAEALKLEEVGIGKPGPGKALIKIAYAGVNFVDVYMRKGIYPGRLPYIPGWEAAGTVEAIGAGVADVAVGDKVAYVHQPGSYAEMSIVDAESLIPLPHEFNLEQGAAFPLQGMTAHYLLHEFRTVKAGDVLLIHAAAGGMGLLLVQWAKHLGAKVIGTVSTEEKASIAYQAGADEIILYTQENFVDATKRHSNGHGADLIIDGVGKTTFSGNLEAAALRGTIVIFGAASGPADPIQPNALMKRSLTIGGGSLMNYILTREEMMQRAEAVIEGIQEGWLKLHIAHVFPLAQADKAHQMLEERKTTGKVLLKA